MVSESTLCLLQDVGELRVFHVDERNPETAIERFRGAQDQLQNPLLFHPQLRRRPRGINDLNTGDLQQAAAGSSSVASEQTDENVRVRIEITEDEEEQCDDVDEISGDTSVNDCDNNAIRTESPESPNAHSVTVEVYSYKQSPDELLDEGEVQDNVGDSEGRCELLSVGNDAAATQQTSEEQDEIGEIHDEAMDNRGDPLKHAAFTWSETDDLAMETIDNGANQDSETDQTVLIRITSESTQGIATVNQENKLIDNFDD